MSALFSAGRIGGLDLENRIVVSPMCQYSAVGGAAQPWHLIHIGNLMMSGAGLVIMEATSIEEIGRGTHGCLGLYTDSQERALADRHGPAGRAARFGPATTSLRQRAVAQSLWAGGDRL